MVGGTGGAGGGVEGVYGEAGGEVVAWGGREEGGIAGCWVDGSG